jgi:predicted AlkP superfamily pyrophosphatase or phosphodiesterase
VPDYLAISFSSTDLIAHWFGPASLESEDNILRLDAALRDLLTFIDQEVGLRRTLVVISADHGGPEYPEYLAAQGIGTGRISPAAIRRAADEALATRYGQVKGIIAEISTPYVYLDRRVIAANGLDERQVEQTIASGLQGLAGVSLALARSDMSGGRDGADEELVRRIRRNQHPGRSGDLYLVQAPQWQIEEAQEPKLLQHGSPWSYDTHVPVAFTGWEVPAAFVLRGIESVDVAATLSALLGTNYPSGCVGTPLMEVAVGAARRPRAAGAP